MDHLEKKKENSHTKSIKLTGKRLFFNNFNNKNKQIKRHIIRNEVAQVYNRTKTNVMKLPHISSERLPR